MKRIWLAAILVCLLLAACFPGPNGAVQAPRLPKAGSTASSGTPALGFLPLATATLGPPPDPNRLIPKDFPPPFTYGPRYALPTAVPDPVETFPFDPEVINVLLLGSDRRSGSSFRTDTILVLSIHPQKRAAALLSIPRDLYVFLPGYNMRRINAAMILGEEYGYPGGGRGMLKDAILYNLGIPIHYYAQVEMGGFRQIVDRLGGVDVRVTCSYTDWRLANPSLNPNDEDNWVLFTVPTGVVHMNGDYALWYARSRARSSDFDRSRRQQEVLRAIHRQALRLDLIPQIPDLYDEMIQAVSTDMSLFDMVRMAPMAIQIDASQIRSRFIGRDQVTPWRTPTGGAVQLPKPDKIRSLLQETFSFEPVDPLVPEEDWTIEVVNGATNQDWGTLAAERLTYAGYRSRLLRSGAEPTSATVLIDYGYASPEQRNDLLSALGIGASSVRQEDPEGRQAYFRLVVGNNFDPCFDPTKLR
jgi:LCP family protein required for cell wall assembly